jgi:hypothetical protein
VTLSSQYLDSGLHVWFRDDIKNTLRAVNSANADLFRVINTPEMRLYRQGYEAAIRSIAEAFGIRDATEAHDSEEPALIIELDSY